MKGMTHYVYGSGSHGCLYDYGPHFSESREDAIEDLVTTFGEDLTEDEYRRMRDDLRDGGYHQFDRPSVAGADYCEITEENGPCPDES